MKSLKIAGFVIGALAVLVLLAVAAALNSSVQTWAVRKVLADQPGMTIAVDQVDAGFSTARVTGLRVAQDGLVATISSIEARYSAWAYLAGHQIDVDELVLKDLVVDLRSTAAATSSATTAPAGKSSPAVSGQPTTSPAAKTARNESPKAAFDGLLKQARLPLDLRIGRVTVNGRATLPDQQIVALELKAAGIGNGNTGTIEWTVDYSDPKAGAPVRAIRSTGTLQVGITRDRRVDLVEVDTTSAAIGPGIPSDQIKLVAKLAHPTASSDEEYSAALSLIRRGKTEPILTAKAGFASAQREIAGTWEIALRSEQLAAVLAGFGLPEIAATGAGKFRLQPGDNAASASGSLRASVTQLQLLSPALAAIGTLQLKSDFDGAVADNSAHLNTFAVELSDGTGRRFAQVNLLQKVSYRLVDRHVTLANATAEAARLTLDAVPLAWAQPSLKPMTVESGDLSLTLAIEAEPDGSRIRARAVAPLALRNVTIRDARKETIVDHITLSTRPSVDYTATQLRAQLAEISLAMTTGDTLSGTISADVTNLATKPATAFKLQLQAKLVTLLKPFLLFDPGSLAASVLVEGRHEGDSLQLARAEATVKRDGDTLLAAVELLQPVSANLKTQAFAAARPTETAARLRLGVVPLTWAEPYVAKSKIAGTFAGASVDVTMRTVDDLAVTTTEAFAVRGLSVTIDGKALLKNLDLTANLSATKRKDAIAYDLRRVEVKQGTTTLAGLTVAGEASLGAKFSASGKGNLEADLAALLTQPALAPFATLTRGQLSTTFEGSTGDATQAKAVISAKNLVAKQDNRSLGDIDLSVTASLKADGSGNINVPLTVTNSGRKSDLLLVGSFGKSADQATMIFNGKLSSANLVTDDLQVLAALAPAGEATPPAPAASARPAPITPATSAATTSRPARDKVPFWQGMNGRAEVDLKRVLVGKDYAIREIRGLATLTNSRLALDNLEGNFRDKPFKLSATITYATKQPQPYALTGLVDVAGVDVGALLRAATPNEKPMLESMVKVAAKVTGNGRTLADLIERSYGTFDVSGAKGVLRALGRKGETVSAASNLLGLAGALTGSANTASLGRLGQELEEMQFDTFALRVERDASLNMKFKTIEFLSPTKRLTGTGTLNYVAGTSFDQWPFQFEFKLAGKDYMAQLLNEARVLSGEKDDKGYYPMATAFPVSGTAAKVSNGLWKILAGTAARAGLEGLLRR